MAASRKHQAVHDWLTQTVVEVSPDADEGTVAFHVERLEEPVMLPPVWRRIVMVLAYLVALLVLYSIALAVADPAGCLPEHSCTGGTRVLVQAIVLAWLALSISSIVVGWKGLLPGARSSPLDVGTPSGSAQP